MEQLDNTFNLGETIDKLKLLLKFYLNNYKIIFVSIIISLCFTSLYYIWEKPKFQADATFVLMESGGNKGGSLASLTSQFGIDIGGLGGQSSIFSGDNIFDIFKSRVIIENTLLSNYPSDTTRSIADIYYEILKKRRFLKFLQEKQENLFKNYNLSNRDRKKDSILNILIDNIINSNLQIDRLNKKSSIIKLTITSSDENLSKAINDKILQNVKEFYTKIKNSNTQIAVDKLQKKVDSLQFELGGISNENFKNTLPTPTNLLNENLAQKLNKEKKYIEYNYENSVNTESIQRKRTITYTLFSEVVKNLEITKLTLAQQTPIFQILDSPRFPLYNTKIRYRNVFMIGIFIGAVLSFIISMFKFFYK
jgi:uncharacterized protein involved in exopolysaccharide biosynthesis